MKRTFIFISLLFAGATYCCQSQEIKGRILDIHSLPVENVQLKLENCGVSTNTDSAGNFCFVSTSVLQKNYATETSFNLLINNNIFSILSTPKYVYEVSIFDSRGRTCNFTTIQNIPGKFIGKTGSMVSGLFFIQIRSIESRKKATFRFVHGLNTAKALTRYFKDFHLRRAETILPGTDTLTCTKHAFLRKRIAVQFGKDSILNLYMYPESLSIQPSAYPVIDGSTSTQPVGIVLASTVLGTTYGYADQDDGSKKMLAFSTSNPGLADSINTMIVKHNSTHDAYVNVINGTARLGLIARSPSSDEIALAESLHVKLEVVPFAMDAFVFLVNRKNTLENAPLENIIKIYSGTITNWSSLGGPNLNIKAYQREKNSGSQEMMISLVMKEISIINSPDMIVRGMMGPFNILSTDTAGIGYTVYFYGKNMAPEQYVKFISVDGVRATSENIRNHTYPLWADVYLANRADLDPTSNAAFLRELILSPKGQKIIKRCGYVPVDETDLE